MPSRDRYRQDVKDYVQDSLNAPQRALLRLLRADLRDGPLYLDEDGEIVSCFDEGARPFDSRRAADQIQEDLEGLTPLYIQPWCGTIESVRPEEGEPYIEYGLQEVLAILGIAAHF